MTAGRPEGAVNARERPQVTISGNRPLSAPPPSREGRSPSLTPAEVRDVIAHAAASAPRSMQPELGPSGAGEPCTRALAYSVLDWPKARARDPWPAVQGTAVHAWLAAAFRAENERLGRERYLIEHRVEPLTPQTSPVPGTLAGNCDLYDRDTRCAVDWKLTSPARLERYAARGPGPRYRVQAHLYALGLQRAGEDVETVAVVFLPRAAELDPVHVWAEPFDPAVAAAAVARLQAVKDAIVALDPESNPERWELFPADYGSCRTCPWLSPGSRQLAAGCPGRLLDGAPAASVAKLIAQAQSEESECQRSRKSTT